MVEPVRTAEDHNGDGVGVPPFPRKYTELNRADFIEVAGFLEGRITLQPETALISVRFEPSDKCKLYGHMVPELEDEGPWSRFVSNAANGHSTLDESRREVWLKVENFDPEGSAASTFEVMVWEW